MNGVSFRLVAAGIVTLMGLLLAAMSFVKVQVLVGIELILASGCIVLGILIGFEAVKDSALFRAVGATVTMLGVFAVFSYSRAFDSNLQVAHFDALRGFLLMETNCSPMNDELRKIQDLGTKSCAMQDNSDQLSAVVDLAKGLHYGTELTLADAVTSAKSSTSLDYCALAFKRAQSVCPSTFSTVSSEKRSTLLDAAK